MDVSRSTEVKVGLVSLLAIILLVAGILVGKGFSFSVNRQTIKIRLATSGGLENGSPVVVNGVKRGSVVDVDNDNGTVLVHAELDDIRDLHADATAQVSILEITGGKKVEIAPGKSGQSLSVAQEIPGKVSADIGSLVGMVGDVSGDLTNLIRRLDTIGTSLTALLGDGQVVSDIRSMTSNGAVLISDARTFVAQNRDDLTTTIRNLKSLTEEVRTAVRNNEPKLGSLLDKLDRTVASVDGTIAKADGMIVNIDSLVSTVNGVITDIRTNKGTLNALLYDETFKRRLDSTISNLRTFINGARVSGVNVNVGIGHK